MMNGVAAFKPVSGVIEYCVLWAGTWFTSTAWTVPLRREDAG